MGLFSQSHGILCVLNIEESFTSLPSLIISHYRYHHQFRNVRLMGKEQEMALTKALL